MKRMSMVVLVVLVAGMAFAAGQVLPQKTFRYVSEAMNEGVAVTRFELRCLQNSSKPLPKPIPACREFEIDHIFAEPTEKGLVVKATAARRPGNRMRPEDKTWNSRMTATVNAAYREACTRFGEGRGEGKPFDQVRDMQVELYVDGKLAATLTSLGIEFAER